jgi:hypothetical protein
MVTTPRALLALLGLWLPAAALAAPQTPQEILQCVRGNEPGTSSVQTVVLRSTDRIGGVTESKATLYWRKNEQKLSDLAMCFFDPPDMRGAALLIDEQPGERSSDIFLYLPELQRVRRVNKHMSGGSIFGTDFTYEDFERVYGLVQDGRTERLPDQQLDGRSVWVVVGFPPTSAESAYERVVSYVDAATCVPLKVEFFELGDRLRKSLVADSKTLLEEGGVRVPRSVVMRDLRDETSSELVVERLEVDREIPQATFTRGWLERCR